MKEMSEKELKYYRDYENNLDLQYDKGVQKGEEIGRQKGLFLTAKNMKKEGI